MLISYHQTVTYNLLSDYRTVISCHPNQNHDIFISNICFIWLIIIGNFILCFIWICCIYRALSNLRILFTATMTITTITITTFPLVFTRTWYVTFVSLLSQIRLLSVVSLSSVVCLSSICNVGAPYSGVWTFRHNFSTAMYLGHSLT